MPAAIPVAIAVAGAVKQHIDANNAKKDAAKQAVAQGTDPASLAANRQKLNDFQSQQYTPQQLQQMLGTGVNGQAIASYKPVDVSQYQNPDWGAISAYQQRTPQEQAALGQVMNAGQQSMGQADQLNQVSMPQLQAVSARNLALLGGNKGAASSAIAPQAEQMAEIQRGAQRGLEANSSIRGAAKQQALAESARLGAGQIASLIPQAQQQAMTSAAQLGTSGQQLRQGALGQAGSLFNTAQAAEAQNRQFGIGADQANRQLGGQLALGAGGLDLQARGQDLNQSQSLLQLLLGQRGQNLQALLGQQGNNTQLLGQQGQLGIQNQDLSNQYNAGLGSTAGGIYQSYLNSKQNAPTSSGGSWLNGVQQTKPGSGAWGA